MNRMQSRKLILPARLDCLNEVTGFIRETMGAAAGCEQEFTIIAVAVEEIFVNIVHYAYPEKEGKVTVLCERMPDLVRIFFIDRGIAYNPLAKEEPDITLPAEDRPIGGLGIWIVRSTMDHVEYQRVDGKNIFMIEKALGCPPNTEESSGAI